VRASSCKSYDDSLGESNSSKTRSRSFLVLVNLISVGCLIWTLHDAKLGELKDDIATMNWWWVALAVIADIAVYCWHGWRWSLLLHPVEPVTIWQTIRAIYVGLFANEVLPFRAGEVLRCYLLSSWTQLPFSVSVTSALIERIFDGIWLCLCLLVTVRIVLFPKHFQYLIDAGYALSVFVVVGAALLAWAMFHHHRSGALLDKPWQRHLRVLVDDLSLIGHSRFLYFAFLQSLPYLLLQVLPIYGSFKGYGFDELSIGAAFTLMVILRLGSVVPQAPGNIGLFQLLTKESLEHMFNYAPADAARFSLVLWGIVTLPLLIGGTIALSVTGARIGELRKAAHVERVELATQRAQLTGQPLSEEE
jgi:glycosyltransferase 2 family protein